MNSDGNRHYGYAEWIVGLFANEFEHKGYKYQGSLGVVK